MVGHIVFGPLTTLSLSVGSVAQILPPSLTTVGQSERCHSIDD